MTVPTILALAPVSLIAAAILNETLARFLPLGRRVGGITFYRLGRYRLTFCKAKERS